MGYSFEKLVKRRAFYYQ